LNTLVHTIPINTISPHYSQHKAERVAKFQVTLSRNKRIFTLARTRVRIVVNRAHSHSLSAAQTLPEVKIVTER